MRKFVNIENIVNDYEVLNHDKSNYWKSSPNFNIKEKYLIKNDWNDSPLGYALSDATMDQDFIEIRKMCVLNNNGENIHTLTDEELFKRIGIFIRNGMAKRDFTPECLSVVTLCNTLCMNLHDFNNENMSNYVENN